MFAGITPALSIGSVSERVRILPTMIFFFLWTTLVYDFVAYWMWSTDGFLFKMGVLDFAGGTVVHINSGISGFIFAYFIGKKHGYTKSPIKANSVFNIAVGTSLLWFGFIGFNCGGGYSANTTSGYALYNSNVSACTGGLVWMFLGYFKGERKYSLTDFCVGAVTGLVAITPGAGYVDCYAAVIFGAVTTAASYFTISLKYRLGVDDSFDVLATLGVGGVVGTMLTGVFASKELVGFGGAVIKGGLIDGNFNQILIQLLSCVVTIAWCTVMTFAILFFINYFDCLKFNLKKEHEINGVDHSEIGQIAYEFIVAATENYNQDCRCGCNKSHIIDIEETKNEGDVQPKESPEYTPTISSRV
ncbi:Ammonium transporter 1 [Smittium culicis]|uniref:Ammonium transporter 1 n=1 Tax=Smittium culicis TaxID=133412 RepID=A0A1R1X7R4_9FUNG|nr:Ammonium transporter 1 [Smittium culicis]